MRRANPGLKAGEDVKLAETRQRLKNGAKVLGKMWLDGIRCPEGWKSVECGCNPKGKFCKAKKQWVDLALQDGRMIEEGDFDLILMMTAEEWDNTGLTLKVEIPDTGTIGIGPKGSIGMVELAKVSSDTMPSILKVFKCFPGSRVTDEVFGTTKPVDAKS